MELPIHPENFPRIAQGIHPCVAFIFPNFIKPSFWTPMPPP